MSLSCVGRGGSAGQAIRDRILDIMHKHKIPENSEVVCMSACVLKRVSNDMYRADANFYEQWHQKLHNNTTPDDIGICTAVIRYLESGGDLNTYWSVLK